MLELLKKLKESKSNIKIGYLNDKGDITEDLFEDIRVHLVGEKGCKPGHHYRHLYVKEQDIKSIEYEVDDITETLEHLKGKFLKNFIINISGNHIAGGYISNVYESIDRFKVALFPAGCFKISLVKSLHYKQENISVTVKVKDKKEDTTENPKKNTILDDINERQVTLLKHLDTMIKEAIEEKESTINDDDEKSPIKELLIKLKEMNVSFSVVHEDFGYLRNCRNFAVDLVLHKRTGRFFNHDKIQSIIYHDENGDQITLYKDGYKDEIINKDDNHLIIKNYLFYIIKNEIKCNLKCGYDLEDVIISSVNDE